ncbi:MAG: DUF2894 domain-containing protein [Pseudomonadota bacterium]
MADDQGHGARLAAWRERGEHRHDPVRFCFIEALARRAQAHQGAARRRLDARVGELLAAYAADLERRRQGDCADDGRPARQCPSAPGQAPSPGPLAQLADLLARQAAPTPASGPAAADSAPGSPGPEPVAELKTLRYFRSTWSRLSAQQRLAQCLATVPENAGPLNSQHLVHRALRAMHDASPEYLERFIEYVDTLLCLEQMSNLAGH